MPHTSVKLFLRLNYRLLVSQHFVLISAISNTVCSES